LPKSARGEIFLAKKPTIRISALLPFAARAAVLVMDDKFL
jgi:hypothetical protein